jgi:pimeloyl-ACP methyl ester carboxylesterase
MDTMIEIRPGRRIKLSVDKGEPGKPTIFMIHGLGGRGYQWREQVKYFKNKYTLIVPDLLGHGASEKPRPDHDNPYSFQALSQDIQALFDKFAGAQNYVFGHSYGGAFASHLSANNQSKIQKLVLVTPVSCQPFRQVPLAYLLPVAFLDLMRTHLDKSFEKLAFAPTDNALLLKEEKEGRALNQMYVIKALLLGMKMIPQLQVAELLLPSLVIAGQLDKVIPVAAVESFYGKLPHHQMQIYADAAHMVHLEKSSEVNLLLSQFLS